MPFLIKNLKQCITRQSLIFILFLLCQIVSILALIFSLGVFQNFRQASREKSRADKEFFIAFPELETVGRIKEAFSLLTLTDYMPVDFMEIDLYISKSNRCTICIEYDETLGQIIYRRGTYEGLDPRVIPLRAGRCPTLEEYLSGQKLAVVSVGMLGTKAHLEDDGKSSGDTSMTTEATQLNLEGVESFLGATIELLGETYAIIGIGDGSTMLSYYAVSDDALSRGIVFLYQSPPTIKQYNAIKTKFESVFGINAVFPELQFPDAEEQRFLNTVILSSLIITLLTAVDLAILFKYLLDTRRKTLAVLRLHGCTTTQSRRLYIGEVMIISVPLFLLCTVGFHFLILPRLAEVFPYILSVYTMRTYGIMFGIYIGVIYAVLNQMILKHVRKTPVRLLKGGVNG